jgi:hypothetical protein
MVGDANIILAFWSGTSYRTLLHKLGRDQSKTTMELLGITTWHASGEETVRVIFVQGDGTMVPSGSRGAPPKVVRKGSRRSANGTKKGKSGTPSGS